jgi:hypothetical protein
MAQLPWVDFLQLHSKAHLLAAVVKPTRSSNHLLRLRRLLANVIEEGHPSADFATAIVRPTEVAEIHCAFRDKGDADRLAELTKARPRPADDAEGGAWATQRLFVLGVTAEAALVRILTAARTATKTRSPPDNARRSPP